MKLKIKSWIFFLLFIQLPFITMPTNAYVFVEKANKKIEELSENQVLSKKNNAPYRLV
ncbi:MAG: hypothetical protein PUP46_01685 [Endozoicomonas sp. (ex Botrylloides leachii)]|nr:hypothetical protein [Endozoicomonas sp. (ex Botrylloides leachii)]